MIQNDSGTAADYNFYGDSRDYADAFFAFFVISGRQGNTEIYKVSGESIAACSFWIVGCILPEGYQCFHGQLWPAGIDCDYGSRFTALLEKAHAFVNRGRDNLLYAPGTICILNFVNWTEDFPDIVRTILQISKFFSIYADSK